MKMVYIKLEKKNMIVIHCISISKKALENLCAALQHVGSLSHNTDEVQSMEGPDELNTINVTFADPEGLGGRGSRHPPPPPLENHNATQFLNNTSLDL